MRWGYFYKSIITYKQNLYLPGFHMGTIYILLIVMNYDSRYIDDNNTSLSRIVCILNTI